MEKSLFEWFDSFKAAVLPTIVSIMDALWGFFNNLVAAICSCA